MCNSLSSNRFIAAFTVFFVILSLYFNPDVGADTLYFKKGNIVEGIITKETGDAIEIEMGVGTVAFKKSQILKIVRSTPEEQKILKARWKKEKQELQQQKKTLSEDREERFNEYEKWDRQERQRKEKETVEVKDIQAARDQLSDSVLVEVVLNDNVNAVLIFDTGASLVVLSKKKGEELGIDLTDKKKDVMELHLAGDRRILAKGIILKSLKVQDVEEKGVTAAVLMEDSPGIGFRDGLLGGTFLKRYNIKIDHKAMKLTLEKLK